MSGKVCVYALALLLLTAGASQAVYTSTWVEVCNLNNQKFTDSDEDRGAVHADCTSYKSLPSGTYGRAAASADLTSSGVELDTSGEGDIAVVGETYRTSATASVLDSTGLGNVYIKGPGEQVVATLEIRQAGIWTDEICQETSLGFSLSVNSEPLLFGAVSLNGNGGLAGSGVYAPDFFDLSFDGTAWRAIYVGPAAVQVELPVGEWFVLGFEAGADSLPSASAPPGEGGSESAQELALVLPAGYVLVPEPLSLLLLIVAAPVAGRCRVRC